MSLFRRDIITVSRVVLDTGKGAQAYSDLTNETLIYSGIPADIQYKTITQKPLEGLPGDALSGSYYEIFFTVPRGTILLRDIITDQNGIRYAITSPYWTIFGYQVTANKTQS